MGNPAPGAIGPADFWFISHQPSAISHQPSAISHQPSAINPISPPFFNQVFSARSLLAMVRPSKRLNCIDVLAILFPNQFPIKALFPSP